MLVISIGLLDTLVRDVKYGLRGLMRNPLLVLITTMSLGLGIGLNILVYSLIRSTLLESPTAADPSGLLNARVEFGSANISFPNYRLLTEATQFSGLAAYTDSVLDVNWQDRDEERTVISQVVSANFFDVLGVRAAQGRTFTASEAQVELSPRLAVLGHSFWRGKLKGDQDVLGHLMVLNGEPFVIIGVLPADYRSIKGFGVTPDIYLPISAAVLPDFNDRGLTR